MTTRPYTELYRNISKFMATHAPYHTRAKYSIASVYGIEIRLANAVRELNNPKKSRQTKSIVEKPSNIQSLDTRSLFCDILFDIYNGRVTSNCTVA